MCTNENNKSANPNQAADQISVETRIDAVFHRFICDYEELLEYASEDLLNDLQQETAVAVLEVIGSTAVGTLVNQGKLYAACENYLAGWVVQQLNADADTISYTELVSRIDNADEDTSRCRRCDCTDYGFAQDDDPADRILSRHKVGICNLKVGDINGISIYIRL